MAQAATQQFIQAEVVSRLGLIPASVRSEGIHAYSPGFLIELQSGALPLPFRFLSAEQRGHIIEWQQASAPDRASEQDLLVAIGICVDVYNHQRLHSALLTPHPSTTSARAPNEGCPRFRITSTPLRGAA